MTKRLLQVCILLVISTSTVFSQTFSEFFTDNTLRVDYLRAGNRDSMALFVAELKYDGVWAGSKTKLIDPLDYGEFKVLVYDSASQQLIYSKGYASLSKEWQTTDDALLQSRSFYEAVRVPFPKKTVRIEIHERDKKLVFHKRFELFVDPQSIYINAEYSNLYPVVDIEKGPSPNKAIDIVIIPDGYTAGEMDDFLDDARRLSAALLQWDPFLAQKKQFAIRAVQAPSQQKGVDIPGDNIWVNTLLSSSFYTFGVDRYLAPNDMKAVYDIASQAPYDQIVILVNSDKYGGGGIYNFYNITTADHSSSEFVFCHEFGHGFAALADEYFTSDVAYNEYFDLDVEPYQANITTLVDFDKKWKSQVDKTTPIPTPDSSKFKETLGVFEGGGYIAKGIYRPMRDCSMKSVLDNKFCPVCQQAIIKVIEENID